MGRRISKSDSMFYRTGYRGGAALFALPFLAAGVYVALVGFGRVPPPSKVNAPLWVVAAIGVAFAMAGLLLLVHALRGMRHHARRRRVVELYPERPWLSDYPWDDSGIDSRLGARAITAVFGTALWCVFLAPFHWWAFLSGAGPWMVQVFVVLFDLVSLIVVGHALRAVLQWAKYGRMRLRFHRFPYAPGGPLDVQFSPNRFQHLRVTLRFVEERMEECGTSSSRSTRLVHEALHEETKEIEAGPLQPEVEFAFTLPADESLVTAISANPVRYWELHVEAEDAGVDFEVSWPLPVYPARGYRGSRKATAPSGGSVTVTD